jgi:hypothetical protein
MNLNIVLGPYNKTSLSSGGADAFWDKRNSMSATISQMVCEKINMKVRLKKGSINK